MSDQVNGQRPATIGDVNALRDDLRRIETVTASQSATLDRLIAMREEDSARIRVVEAKQGESQPTNWGWVVAAITLFLFVGSLALGPISERLGDLAGEFENHRDRDGHPAMVERVGQTQKDIARIDQRDYEDRERQERFRETVAEFRGEVKATLAWLAEDVRENEVDIASIDGIVRGILRTRFTLDDYRLLEELQSEGGH